MTDLLTRPTFTRADVSRDPQPHIVLVYVAHPNDYHRKLRAAVGPFPDELAALSYIEERDLGRSSYEVALICPLTPAGSFEGGE